MQDDLSDPSFIPLKTQRQKNCSSTWRSNRSIFAFDKRHSNSSKLMVSTNCQETLTLFRILCNMHSVPKSQQ